uniref:hypothetical protein n=6 Tax=Escherichia coli TaxID=562 RepID=UPI001CD1183A
MASWGSYVFELCRINANQGLTAEIDWNYTSWSRRCRKILIGLVVRGAKTVVVRGKNRILTQNREKLEMTVPISFHNELNLQSKCNKKRSTHQLEYNFVSTQK